MRLTSRSVPAIPVLPLRAVACRPYGSVPEHSQPTDSVLEHFEPWALLLHAPATPQRSKKKSSSRSSRGSRAARAAVAARRAGGETPDTCFSEAQFAVLVEEPKEVAQRQHEGLLLCLNGCDDGLQVLLQLHLQPVGCRMAPEGETLKASGFKCGAAHAYEALNSMRACTCA